MRGEMGIGETRLVEAAAGGSARPYLAVPLTADLARRPFGVLAGLITAIADHVGDAPVGGAASRSAFVSALTALNTDPALADAGGRSFRGVSGTV